MSVMRSLLLTIMIIAFLPWGAFSANFALATATEISGSEKLLSPDPSGADRAVVVANAKRCKGPALLGSPCGPAMIVTIPAKEPAIIESHSKAKFAWRSDRLDGTDDSSTLDPPILA